MDHGIRPVHRFERYIGIRYVAVDEAMSGVLGPLTQIFQAASVCQRIEVDHLDVFALSEQQSDQRGADEPGPTGDEESHVGVRDRK